MTAASASAVLGLEEDFGGDEFGVVGDDAAGVDQAGGGGLPLDEAVDAVAGDSGLVADDGAARASEAIEERRLADVGAAADGDEGERAGGGGVGVRDRAGRRGFRLRARHGFRRGIRGGEVRGSRFEVRGGGRAADFGGRWWGGRFGGDGAAAIRLSGERVGVRFCLARSPRLVERDLRLRGTALTAPVVGVVRGARPCLGRVDA